MPARCGRQSVHPAQTHPDPLPGILFQRPTPCWQTGFLALSAGADLHPASHLLPGPLHLPDLSPTPPPPFFHSTPPHPQTLGLTLTTATRAGFLIQATALLTPLLASFAGEKIGRNVWIGCAIALSGCLFIASDATATDADEALFSLGGDAAILSSAFFFSLATVRLGTYARRIPSVELAAAKSVVLGTIAFATFVAVGASMVAAGDPITDLWPNWDSSPVGWAVLCYSALGPGAAAAFLHAKGQSVVSPAEAQVIFSSTPLWSVAFAVLLLGGEPMSWKTIVGGLAVVAAGLVASRKSEADAPPTDAAAAAVTAGADKAPAAKDGKQE